MYKHIQIDREREIERKVCGRLEFLLSSEGFAGPDKKTGHRKSKA